MLLNADSPQALDALGLCVIVTIVGLFRVDLGDAEGEQGEREQFECVLGGGAVVDFGEKRVLCASLLVCGR